VSEELERLAARLHELAGQIRDSSQADERVEELAREAADLAARAGSEAEAASRRSAGDADG
jgi:hypothetical protein